MGNKMRRFLTLLVVLCVGVCLLSVSAMAEEVDYVAQIGVTKYETLQDALTAAAETKTKDVITLLVDIEVDEVLVIDSHVEINGAGHTVTGNASKTFEVYDNTIMKNIKIVNTAKNGRCVDTRKAVYLKLQSGTTLVAINGCTQPLTIGGSAHGANVTLTGVNINAGENGYGIIAFVKTNLIIDKASEISGYAALYMKEGTTGSAINVRGASVLTSTNVHGSDSQDFGTIVYEDGNTTTKIHQSSKIIANNTGDALQALFLFNGGSVEQPNIVNFIDSGKAVTLTPIDNLMVMGTNLDSAVINTLTTATKLAFENAGYTVNEEGLVNTAPVAEVDGVQLTNFDYALEVAAERNAEVKLLADVTLPGHDFKYRTTHTFDLAGHTLTFDGHVKVVHNCHLTFGDSVGGGKVLVTDHYVLTLYGNNNTWIMNDGAAFVGHVQINNVGNTSNFYFGETAFFGYDGCLQNVNGNPRMKLLENGDVELTHGEYKVVKNLVLDGILIINKNVTLDLNGKSLTASQVVVEGYVIDSTDGTGSIVSEYLEFAGHTNNNYLPIKDAANGCYKFFKVEVVAKGVKLDMDAGKAKFGFALQFTNAEAYALMANALETNPDFVVAMEWNDGGVTGGGERTFADKTLAFYSGAAYEKMSNGAAVPALTLTMNGVEASDTISATACIKSAGVVISSQTINVTAE